ncbi:hypothetical protein [Arthrobacter sp. NyZ413]|uniref:hypothetical protein n=1 Tax=Arthrobacter sp. NyZ413 TaxID=3144669 RepID=UPI003BF8E7BE
MARPAHVYQCYGLKQLAYLVKCDNGTKDRLFPELEDALAYAQDYNNKHHQGQTAHFHSWDTTGSSPAPA